MTIFTKNIFLFYFTFNSILCSEIVDDQTSRSDKGLPVFIEEIIAPEQVSSSETSFDIRLKGNTSKSDINCSKIQYNATVTETSLNLSVERVAPPPFRLDDGSISTACNDQVVPFGERIYTVKANPHFALGDFLITIQNPDYQGDDLQKVVKIVE